MESPVSFGDWLRQQRKVMGLSRADLARCVGCAAVTIQKIEVDERRLLALSPTVDIGSIRTHLAIIPLICQGGEQAGPIGQLSQRERFDWLVAPRSTMIQTSSVHTGRCTEPAAVIERLLIKMVR